MQEFFSVDTIKPKIIRKLIRVNAILAGIYCFILLLKFIGILGAELQWYAYNSTYLFGLSAAIITLFTFSSRDRVLIAISVLVFIIAAGIYIFLSPYLKPDF